MADQRLLLIEDVDDLGRSGDVVRVKPGYARNYLLPRGFGVIASKNALRMQERLQEERQKRAEEDRKEAEKLAELINGTTVSTEVKVDQEGHMYGSVTAVDVCNLVNEEKGCELEKRNIVLAHPIKEVGIYELELRLKEDVPCGITLKVIPEGGELPEPKAEEPEAEAEAEAPAEAADEAPAEEAESSED